jgi:hypothetical protein
VTQRRDDAAAQRRDDAVAASSDTKAQREGRTDGAAASLDATAQRLDSAKTALPSEVGEFLSKYAERYVERDIEGFLLLFSSQAVLNRKDELGGIRRIYTQFFIESSELRYRLRNPVVEVNQTFIEVKARFEVDQVLKKGGEKKLWCGQIRWSLLRENDVLKIASLDYQYD